MAHVTKDTTERTTVRAKLKWKLSSIPLTTRLVAVVLAFLFIASSVLVIASQQLVSSALLQKMDTQIMRQATLVVNNLRFLQNENASSSVNDSTQNPSTDMTPKNNAPSLREYLSRGSQSGQSGQSGSQNGQIQAPEDRPKPYSTTGNQNLGPADYFVQIRDADNNIVSMPLVPIAHDGVISIPTLPAEGNDGKDTNFEFNEPMTVPASVDIADKVSLNDYEAKMAYSPWRVVAIKFVNASTSEQLIAYVGLSLFDVNETTQALTLYFVWAAVAIVVSAGFLAFLAIRRSLRPLKRIEHTAAKIAAGDLSQRVDKVPENTEIGSLSASLNTMLSRIERSFKKQEEVTNQMKRFVSDASHELRTPLAVIHGSTELYKMQRNAPGMDPVESADMVIDHIDKSSSRMSALVEDLLSLARLDEGRGIDLAQTIKVHNLLADSAEDLHALDPDRVITLGRLNLDAGSVLKSVREAGAHAGSAGTQERTAGAHASMHDATDEQNEGNEGDILTFVPGKLPDISAGGDPVRMRQVITNIIGNIHRYTPANSPVEVAASVVGARMDARDFATLPSTQETLNMFLDDVSSSMKREHALEYVVIRISDHGPGMSEENRARIFERFYTADPSRAREKGGTGLGMSIVQSVVKAHHGLICATATPGGGLTFTVVLPISQTTLFRENDPAEEKLREKNTAPAIFGKRRRAAGSSSAGRGAERVTELSVREAHEARSAREARATRQARETERDILPTTEIKISLSASEKSASRDSSRRSR